MNSEASSRKYFDLLKITQPGSHRVRMKIQLLGLPKTLVFLIQCRHCFPYEICEFYNFNKNGLFFIING